MCNTNWPLFHKSLYVSFGYECKYNKTAPLEPVTTLATAQFPKHQRKRRARLLKCGLWTRWRRGHFSFVLAATNAQTHLEVTSLESTMQQPFYFKDLDGPSQTARPAVWEPLVQFNLCMHAWSMKHIHLSLRSIEVLVPNLTMRSCLLDLIEITFGLLFFTFQLFEFMIASINNGL